MVSGFEVKPRVRLSERFYSTKQSFEILYVVSKALRGGAWFRGLKLNLGCDFQRALIEQKIV